MINDNKKVWETSKKKKIDTELPKQVWQQAMS